MVIDKDVENLYDIVNERLKRMLNEELPAAGPDTAYELWRRGFTDPVRVFVKKEPHTKAKMKQKRYRLVSSVAIADEIIERLLFSEQNEAEIDNWRTCPSKPGLGLSLDQQVADLNADVEHRLGPKLKKSDVSGWDWNFKDWLYDMDLLCRAELNSGPGKASWKKLAEARFTCLKYSLFITSSGKIYAQTKPGIMLSGSYITSSTNSRGRACLAVLFGAEWVMTMGDDCLEENEQSVQNLMQLYEKYGFRIRDVEECLVDYEFCSHLFTHGKAVPQNFWKGCYRLLSKDPSDMEFAQFMHEYRNVDDLPEFVQFLIHLPGWSEVIKFI